MVSQLKQTGSLGCILRASPLGEFRVIPLLTLSGSKGSIVLPYFLCEMFQPFLSNIFGGRLRFRGPSCFCVAQEQSHAQVVGELAHYFLVACHILPGAFRQADSRKAFQELLGRRAHRASGLFASKREGIKRRRTRKLVNERKCESGGGRRRWKR